VKEFLSGLLNLNMFLWNNIRATQAYDEALAYIDAEEYRKAAPLLKESAELGNVDAMAVYGGYLLLGQGVQENGLEAVRWLELAVEKNQVRAIATLGMAYASGNAGVKPNHKRARELLNRAVAEGDHYAVEMLDAMDKKKGIFKHLKG
jgi:TPR repeat protein